MKEKEPMGVTKNELILVIDDDSLNMSIISEFLKEHNFKVVSAQNGKQGIRQAKSSRPDLILLDVLMPGIDGFETCLHLKSDEVTKDIPIIFMTSLTDVEDQVKGFAAGGVDYITKPVQGEVVLARVETHLAVRNLQKSLEQQIAELDAFAHTVAHNLKSPLSILTGYGSFLTEELADTQNKRIRECLDAIVRTGSKMDIIIDELLLLSGVSRMEKLTLKPLNMVSIVAGAKERLVGIIAEYQAQVILPPEWPKASGHGPWVEEVWINYISNAIKYGGRPDKGIAPHIELGADQLLDQLTKQPMIRFWVRDNGPGLTPEEQEDLFTEFTRLHHVQAKGYGLGLSIVRRIVEKLGGEVGVESEVGSGSTFFFTLPMVAPSDGPIEEQTPTPE